MCIRNRIQTAYIYSSLRCNLSCRHCIVEASENSSLEMDLLEIQAILTDLSEVRPCEINITGGEPFLYRGLIDLVRSLREFNRESIISISTNGTIFDYQVLTQIDHLINSINISIDGFQEEHDYLRGSGTFDLLVKNLSKFFQLRHTSINANVLFWNRNASYLPRFVEMLRSNFAFSEIRIMRLLPFGRARDYMERTRSSTDPRIVRDQSCSIDECLVCDQMSCVSYFPHMMKSKCVVEYAIEQNET